MEDLSPKTVVFAVVMAAVVFNVDALAAGQRTMEGILVWSYGEGWQAGLLWVLASERKKNNEPAVVLIDHAQAIAARDLNRRQAHWGI